MVRIFIVALAMLALPVADRAQVQDQRQVTGRIPDNWIDLPEAPFVAVVRNGQTALLNRSKQTFTDVGVGCVFIDGPTVRIDHGLMGVSIRDGAYPPGASISDLMMSSEAIDFYERAHVLKRCPDGSRQAVINANGRSGAVWSAEGTAAREELLGLRPANAVIIGTARDSGGGIMPGVTITATSNGKSSTATTNSQGEYAIVGLDRGTYQVAGVLAGFRTVKCDSVSVGAVPANCDLQLTIGGPPISESDPRYQTLLAAESRWRAAGIRSYEYAVSVGCFCGFDRTPFAIHVIDGTPAPIAGTDPWRNKAGEHYNTIEKLFGMVRAAFARGDEVVDVTYDASTGVPLTISLDMSKHGEDDDVFIVVSEFKIIRVERLLQSR